MKMIKYSAVLVVLSSMGAIYCANADDSTTTTTTTINPPTTQTTITTTTRNDDQDYPLYRPQELDMDLFGSGVFSEHTIEHHSGSDFRHHSLYGGGGGLTGFFCRYVGVGGEFNADTRNGRFMDTASGNVYLRLPILETGLAPYIFGGGGYQFEDVSQSFGQGGAGLEFRFCHHIGIFADGRWVFANRTDDYAVARVGLRISF